MNNNDTPVISPDRVEDRHPRIIALLDWLCVHTGHFGGCGLFNRRIFFCVGENCVGFWSPTYRLWKWALGLPS